MNKWKFKLWRLMNPGAEGGDLGGGSEDDIVGDDKGISSEERLAKLETEFLDVKKERDALKADKDRMLKDTKTAKEKAADAAKETKKLEEQKAREEGNYKSLLETEASSHKETLGKLLKLEQDYAKEQSLIVARQIAAKLTDPNRPGDAILLAKDISDRLRFNIETKQMVVLDKNGEETYATTEQFEKEVESDDIYASILKSSQRTGGGAAGARGRASLNNKTITREQFNALSPTEKAEKANPKNGFSIVDIL